MSKLKIVGVFPPMITPFTEDGEVDYSKHINNIKKWNQMNLGGYVVLGSNSETVFLTEEEKLKLIKITVDNASKDKLIVVGTGMESTKATIDLTNKAAKLGAHAALILTPFYYGGKMNDEALISYFTEVANNVEIPILIYNVTKFTHINISPNAVKELNKHPNIIGMKDSSGSIPQLVTYMDVIDDDFNLIVGTASSWYPALTLGIKAGILALANCAPNECIEVQRAYDKKNYDRARDIYLKMFPVNNAVTGQFGIAGLKYACELVGFEAGNVRSPLLPLKELEKEKIKEILNRANLI